MSVKQMDIKCFYQQGYPVTDESDLYGTPIAIQCIVFELMNRILQCILKARRNE
jgi:hypothetical protein